MSTTVASDGTIQLVEQRKTHLRQLLIPARPMARSPAMKPAEVPETKNQPGVIGRAGVHGS